MSKYILNTTVDITRTNPDRDERDSIRLAQQSNFNSLLQGIGMRSNVEWDKDPQRVVEDNKAVWHWEFECERPDVFKKGNDPVGLLLDDLQGIPIMRNLTNTEPLEKPIFITRGDTPNIWIITS